jgi:hypothetical protein
LIQGGAIQGLRKARDILLFNNSIVRVSTTRLGDFTPTRNISVNMVL